MKKIFILILSIGPIFTDAQNVGIGTPNPQNKLHVAGGFRLDTLTGVNGAGLVRHDANGVVYGIKFSGNSSDVLRGDGSFGALNINGAVGWLLNGNSGTNPATHFLGTIDNVPFNIRVNNLRSGLIETASGNTSWGYQTLTANTTGTKNTAVGKEALSRNAIGSNNTAIGFNALLQTAANSVNNGSNNTAVGSGALSNNTLGLNNTATGFEAMSLGQISYENAAFGAFTLKNNNAPYNNAFGNYAMFTNTTGAQNSAFGFQALASNSIGNANTAMGFLSMQQNTGSENTAIGSYTLTNNKEGQFNTAVGNAALKANTGGWNNTAVGTYALNSNNNEFADNNVAIGSSSLFKNSTGIGNVAVGQGALYNNLSGSNNIAIGRGAGINLPNNVSNVTVIGYETGWNTTVSNQINVGNFSVTWIGGQVGWFHYSDKRIKNDIKDDVPGLLFITKLRPITYHVDVRKQEEIVNQGRKVESGLTRSEQKDWEGKYNVEKIKMTGFFAQDVEEAAKAINYSFSGVHNPKNGGLLSIDYSAFVVPLVKAVQEQQSTIEKQQKLIDELLKRIMALENK